MSQTKAQLISDLVQALNFTGTASAPANGLFLSASNQLKLATASTERLKIDGTEVVVNDTGASVDFRVEGDTITHLLFADASTDRIGIGTSSPSTIFVVSNAGAEGLEISHSSGTVELNAYNRSGSARSPVDIVGQTFAVKTGNPSLNNGLYQDSSGKVHIGLTNGTGQFNVKNSNDATTNALEIYNDNGVRNAAFSQSSTGDATMDLRTNAASQTVLIRSNGTSHFNGGNVGIGTDSPSANLHVHTAANDSGLLIKSTGNTSNAFLFDANRTGANAGIGGIKGRWNGTTVAQISFNTGDDTTDKNDGYIFFGTESAASNGNVNAGEQMRLTSAGTLHIGTSVTNQFNHKLCIEDTSGAIFYAQHSTSGIQVKLNLDNGNDVALFGTVSSDSLQFVTANSNALNIDSSQNIGIGIDNQNNKLEIGTASHYVLTNSGQARNGLHIRGQGGNNGEFGGAISFGCNNTGAAAIAAEQMSSDSDVVGLSFFTHASSTGADDAKKRVKIMQNGGIILNNYEVTRGFIFQRLGTGTYPDFANVQGSSGRGICAGQRDVAANTATEIAKSHWGGLAIVGYSNSQHQGTAQVMFGYGAAGASVKFEGHWVRQESLTITFSVSLYSLMISHNATNDLSVWCVLVGV